jgi:predicted RNA-binding protein
LDRNYWLELFTSVTWKEFQDAGSSISGFRESRWNICKKIAKGDYLLCYLTGASRFVGVVEVISGPFRERARNIWKHDNFTCRFKVKPIVVLSPETGIPIFEIRNNLSFFRNGKSLHGWINYFCSSPAKWKKEDGELIVKALLKAKDDMSIF